MLEPAEVELRTLELPQGLFVVLWEQEVENRKWLAIIPQEEAQAYLEAVEEGMDPEVEPQVVEELEGALHPVPQADVDRLIHRCVQGWTQG